MNNAHQIAETTVSAVSIATRTGDTALNLFINSLKGFPPADFCDAGGSYSWSPIPALPVSEGNSYNFSFSVCTNSELEALYSGTFRLTINHLEGDAAGDAYDATVLLDGIDIIASDGVGDSTISGGVLFSRKLQSGGLTQRAAKAGSNLSITESGVTESISQFDISSTQSLNGASYSIGNTGEYVIVDPGYLSGAVKITIQQPIAGANMEAPDQGKLIVTAQDNSRLLMTVTAGNVALEVDTNGDGVIDGVISSLWDDLN